MVIIEVVFQAFIFFNQLRQLTHGQRAFDQAVDLFTEFFLHFYQWHDAFTYCAVKHGSRQGIFINIEMRENIRHFNTGIEGIRAMLNRTL